MNRIPLLALLLLCALAILTANGSAMPAGDPPRIAILSAFDAETAPLRQQLTEARTLSDAGWTVTLGRLAGHEVLVLSVGESMVNAAMNTQRALERFEISHILVVGIAGGLGDDLPHGAVVVPQRWAHHQKGLYPRALGDLPPWYDAPVAPFGILHPKPVRLRLPGQADTVERFWFPADPDLFSRAQALAQDGVTVGGVGVSGQVYVAHAGYGAYLHNAFGARVVDMESSAIAQVAKVNSVPFLAVRAVSDHPGEPYSAIEHHYRDAIANANAFVHALIAGWSP